MEFFCYHRDRPGSAASRDDLLEEHWSYMDRYASGMIARGSTLATPDTYADIEIHSWQFRGRPSRAPHGRLDA